MPKLRGVQIFLDWEQRRRDKGSFFYNVSQGGGVRGFGRGFKFKFQIQIQIQILYCLIQLTKLKYTVLETAIYQSTSLSRQREIT